MIHKIDMMDREEQQLARQNALLWIYWVFEGGGNPTLNEPLGAAKSMDMLSSEFPEFAEAKDLVKMGDLQGALELIREVMGAAGISEDDVIRFGFEAPKTTWWLKASYGGKKTQTKPCLNGKEPSKQTTVTIAQRAEEDINPYVLQWLNTKMGDRTPLEWLGECPQRDTPLRMERFPFSSMGNNIISIKLPNTDRIIGVNHEGMGVLNIVWTGTHAQYNTLTGGAPRSRIQEIASRIPGKIMWAPPVFSHKMSNHHASMMKRADAWTEGDGDCFNAAIKTMIDMSMEGRKGDMLVHGLVWGRGGASGHRFPHAWVESHDGMCIDRSNGNNVTMPCVIYHALGGVRTDQPGAYRRYTMKEMLKMIDKHGHAGSWELDESLQRVPGDRRDDGDVPSTMRGRKKEAQQSQPQQKTMHIMRGVTGYGKSTLCRRMARDLGEAGSSTAIHCPDDAHMTAPTEEHPEGTYDFKPQILGRIHAENLQSAIRSMDRGVDHVFIDATNLLLERMKPYVEAALQRGYRVNFIDMHEQPGVPTHQELMERHRRRGERIPGFDLSNIVGRMEAQYQPFVGKTNEERVQEVLDSGINK